MCARIVSFLFPTHVLAKCHHCTGFREQKHIPKWRIQTPAKSSSNLHSQMWPRMMEMSLHNHWHERQASPKTATCKEWMKNHVSLCWLCCFCWVNYEQLQCEFADWEWPLKNDTQKFGERVIVTLRYLHCGKLHQLAIPNVVRPSAYIAHRFIPPQANNFQSWVLYLANNTLHTKYKQSTYTNIHTTN